MGDAHQSEALPAAGRLRHGGTYRRIRNLPAGTGEGIYAGILAETGNAWPAGGHATLSDLHRSLTMVLGADTVLGPVFLAYARAETGSDRFYLTIGKTF